jgi:hypothetical protein
MSKNEETKDFSSASDQKCPLICLLLFVGFIIGYSVGFATHDSVYNTFSKVMNGNGIPVSPTEIAPALPVKQADDAAQEEEVPKEEVKPEEKKEEAVPDSAPAPPAEVPSS